MIIYQCGNFIDRAVIFADTLRLPAYCRRALPYRDDWSVHRDFPTIYIYYFMSG